MSNSNGIGTDRRLRIAGVVLLGIAVLAVLIGVVVATTRGEQPPAAAPPEPAATPTPDSRPSTIPYPPTSSPAAAPIVPPLGPPDAAEDVPVSDEGFSDQGRSRGEVRVYNNSTIRGLAARAAADLTAAGWTVIEVGNYAQGTIPTTTVYYQTVDYQEQRDDAEDLASVFGMRVEPRFPGIANSSPGLIVIVTNDYVSP